MGRPMWRAALAALVLAQGAAGTRYGSPAIYQEGAVDASLAGAPGGTRSTVKTDYSLIAPESRVYAPAPGWTKASVAHVVSPAYPTGAAFSMYLAEIPKGGSCAVAPRGHARFVMALRGEAVWTAAAAAGQKTVTTKENEYAFFPAHEPHTCTTKAHTTLLVYEKAYHGSDDGETPTVQHGDVEASPLLPTGVEVFKLRKLLPQALAYDFNVHVMDFLPGEYLKVREVHHNQHGLLLVNGEGIYRLGDDFFPVTAGDAIYMAPYVPQWYGALGTNTSRYVLYKDTNREPATYAGAHGVASGGAAANSCAAA